MAVKGLFWLRWCITVISLLGFCYSVLAQDLDQIKSKGVLRHLGVPYANFISGAGDGMDVELMQDFAAHLGVRYQFVRTDWGQIIGDLIGKGVKAVGDEVEIGGKVPIRGDVIATGMTIIPWREKVVAFGNPSFPTQVWLVSRADAQVSPIKPSGLLEQDILATKSVLSARSLLGKLDTCLDPALYNMEATGARISLFRGTLNELAPAVINKESEFTLLDVPDALVALQKWPGQIKIIGPVSEAQSMAPAFRPDSGRLREAFNAFLAQRRADGRFQHLVTKYYPFVSGYFPEFLASN